MNMNEVHAQRQLRITRNRASTLFLLLGLIGSLVLAGPVQAQTLPRIGNFCAGQFVNPANCTANDVLIESFEIVEVVESCRAGTPGFTTVRFNAIVQSNSPNRYGIGLFINLDGESAITGGTDPNDPTLQGCLQEAFSPFTSDTTQWDEILLPTGDLAYIEPFPELNDDQCGDIPGQSRVLKELQTVTLRCVDRSGDGFVDINACSSWENNANSTCSVPATDAVPGTPSKCGCSEVPTGIPAVDANLELTKTVNGLVGTPENRVNIPENTAVEYRIEILNPSLLAVTDVVFEDVIDTLGDRLDLVNVTSTPAGLCQTADFNDLNDTLTCDLGTVDPNGQVIIDVRLEDLNPGVCINFDNVATTLGSDGFDTFTNTSNTTYARLDVCPQSEDPGIRILKGTIPAQSPQEFLFTATDLPVAFTDPDNQLDANNQFVLTGEAGDAGTNPPNELFLVNPPAGTYVFDESVTVGWALEDIECVNEQGDTFSTSSVDLQNREATITFVEGGRVKCTFTNRLDTGNIIVEKATTPAVTNQAFQFSGSWTANNFSITGSGERAFLSVPTGDYTVSEIVPAGWDLNTASCRDEATNQTVAAGTNAPLAFTLGTNQTIRCIFGNSVQPGQIAVTKIAQPDNGTSFEFNANFADGNFNLTNGQVFTAPDLLPTGLGFANVPTRYNVGEVFDQTLDDLGWALTSAICRDVNDPDAGTFSPSSIPLAPGQSILCTFTNTLDGEILVEKITDPVGSAQPFTFDVSWQLDDIQLTGGQLVGSGPLALDGTYSVSETVPNGWTQESVSCVSSIAANNQTPIDPTAITLDAGEIVQCTFVNNIDRGSITVNKVTDPAQPNQATPQSFTFVRNFGATNEFNLGPAGSEVVSELLPVSETGVNYSVSETVPDGWTLDSATCVSDARQGALSPASIDLQPGENVTCTFTNVLDRGSITVRKVTVPDTDEQFVFDLSANFNDPDNSVTLGQNGEQQYGPLLPSTEAGTYQITEDPLNQPANWDFLEARCTSNVRNNEIVDTNGVLSIDLLPGEDLICTFENTQGQGEILVRKVVPNAELIDETFDFAGDLGDFQLTASPDVLFESLPILAGTYTITELVPDGWVLESIECLLQSQEAATFLRTGDSVEVTVNAGDVVTCTFTNDVPLATVVIRKETNVDTNQTFGFSTERFGPAEPFFLGKDEEFTINDVVPAGFGETSYNIFEIPQTGWVNVDRSCDNGQNPDRITPEPGQTVTCTFVNNQNDITVTKSSNPVLGSVVNPGDPIVYTVSVVIADAPSTAVLTLTDQLDPGLTLQAESLPQGCAAAGQVVTCTLPADTATGTYNFTYTAVVNELASGQVDNVVVPSGDDNPRCELPSNCTTSHPLDPVVTVSKSSNPVRGTVVSIGDTIVYTVNVNVALAPTEGVVTLTDTVSAGSTINANSLPAGCSVNGQVITCTLAAGASPGNYAFTYSVRIGESAVGQVNNVVVPSGEDTPRCLAPADCTTSHPLDPDVLVRKDSDPVRGTLVAAGDVIEYTVTATVANATTSSAVTLTDTLSDGLTLDATTLPNTCSAMGQVITCTLAAGSAPGSYPFSYSATVDADAEGQVSNVVLPSGEDNPGCESPQDCTTSHPVLTLNASSVCRLNAAYVLYDVTVGTLDAGLAEEMAKGVGGLTIRWNPQRTGPDADVPDLLNQPLSGQVLWPGVEVDANGQAISFPGFEFDPETGWRAVPTALRPTIGFEVELDGASLEQILTYPPSLPSCITTPEVEGDPIAVPTMSDAAKVALALMLMMLGLVVVRRSMV